MIHSTNFLSLEDKSLQSVNNKHELNPGATVSGILKLAVVSREGEQNQRHSSCGVLQPLGHDRCLAKSLFGETRRFRSEPVIGEMAMLQQQSTARPALGCVLV